MCLSGIYSIFVLLNKHYLTNYRYICIFHCISRKKKKVSDVKAANNTISVCIEILRSEIYNMFQAMYLTEQIIVTINLNVTTKLKTALDNLKAPTTYLLHKAS